MAVGVFAVFAVISISVLGYFVYQAGTYLWAQRTHLPTVTINTEPEPLSATGEPK